MARRKGISKSKTSAKKLTTETSQTIINENSKVKDDPGGNVCITPAMEIVQKRIIELNNQLQQQQQQTSKIITTAQQTSSGGSSLSSTITTTNPVQTTVPTNSNDLKYLHKKFKRFENQTTKLNDNNNLLQIISTPVINVTTNTSTIHTATTTTTTTNNDYYKNNNLLNGINNNNNNNHNNNNNNNNLEKTTTIINQRLLDGNDGSLEQLSLNKLTITNTTTATTTTPTTITTLINGIENQNNNNKLINNILINNNYYNINNLSANNLSNNNNNNSVNFTNINNNSSNNQQIITTTTSTTNTATVQHQQQQQQQHHQSQQQQQQENHFNINHHLLNQSNKSASLNYIISNNNNNNNNNSNNINNIYNNNSFVTTTNTATTTVSSLSSSSLASTTFFNPGLLVASQQQQQQSQQHLQNGYELTTTSTVNKQQQPPQQIPSTISSSSTSSSSSSGQPDNNNINNLIIGRHVCPYCQLNCSKPSVLQKHIRAHTNERPYPCVPCGCAFKTKSNLYKHQRSRTHILRTEGIEPPDDDISLGSDQDQDHEMNSNSTGLDILSRTASPMDDRICSSPSQPPIEKPYKPKFHLAGIYTKDDIRSQTTTATTGSGVIGLSINVTVATAAASISTITQSSSSSSCGIGGKKILGGGGHSSSPKHLDFEQHISKLISENAAIVEGGKPPVQKKSMKITGLSRSLVTESSSSKLALALLKREETLNINNNNNSGNNNNNNVAGCSTKIMRSQSIQLQQPILNNFSQPLNLSKITSAAIAAASATGIITNDNIQENSRKRCYSEGFSGQDVANHPQNPERSIIKDLLLNSKGFGAVSSNETDETLFTCPFCKISFRNAENLKYHTICYCQGSQANSPQSEPISPVASPSSHLYFRSNSVHLQYQDTVNSPNSLAKLASTSLRQQPYHTSRGLPSLAKLARNKIKLPRPKPENIIINPIQSQPIIDVQTLVQLNKSIDFIQTPLPSPGPLLGKTRLVDTYNHNDRIPNDVTITFVTNNNNNNSSSSSCSNNNNINNETNGPNNNNNGCNTNNNNNNNLSSIYDNNNEKYGKRPYITNSMQHQFALPIIEEISPRRINLQMFGGDCKILDNKKNDFIMSYNSGGSVKSLSPMSQSDSEPSPILVRSGLLSGGTAIQLPQNQQQQKTPQTPKLIVTNAPTLNATIITTSIPSTTLTHFQFPPINTISGYNPLTLPPIQITSTSGQATTILHGGKMIPFVPGMPGPNTLIPKSDNSNKRIVISPNNNRNKNVPSPLSLQQQTMLSLSTPLQLQPQTIYSPSIPNNFLPAGTLPRISPTPPTTPSHQRNSDDHLFMMKKQNKNGIKGLNIWSPAKQELKKTFNYTRIADNLSPRKIDFLQQQQQQTINNKNFLKSPETEVRHFNYENLISKSQILIKPPENKSQMSPLHVDTTSMPVPSINIYEKKGISPREQQMDTTPIITSVKSSKFLRPTSLPLKPGTFAQKMHHGITPTQNTLPLISPETPRPSKNCIQLYLNGHAYTYLGLKCSTKMTYCTLNRAQPVYITVQQNLSMYSEWRIQGDYNPHPLGISPSEVISLYDSRQRPMKYSIAKMKTNTNLIHSQSIIMTPYENSKLQQYNNNNSDHHNIQPIELNQMITTTSSSSTANLPLSSPLSSSNVTIAPVPGGYESNEDYTYVRGRGRGRYVCSECGIRCKKPSMLKKHIRTHTDVRPYTCKICSFSFKTKGNLTKHMKSKTHYKKCIELGLSPVSLDDDSIDLDNDNDHHSITGSGRTSTVPGDSDTETDTDGDDGETESSDTDESKSRLPEHEAARCLISLSMTSPINSLTSSQQSLQNVSYSYMDQNLSSDSHHEEHGGNRRVITFASPKAEFNLSKHGQYYSNPNLHRNLRQNEVQNSQSDDPMPIDLTKPKDKINRSPPKLQQPQTQQLQQHQQRNIHPKFSETDTVKFMTSLVSIMDKIPPTTPILNNNNHPVQIDENILLHQYLTERALQDSKMKQSQMIKMVSSLTTTTTTLTSSTTSQSQGNYTNNITNNRNNNHLRTVTALSLPISSSISLPIDIIDRKIQQNNNTIIDGVNINYKNSLLMKKNNNQIIFQKNLNIDDDNNENSNNIISNEISIKLLTQSSTKLNKSLETGQISNKGGNVIFTRNETQKILEKPEINVYDNRIDTNTASGMDTLAEIAASSIKLEINPIITSSPSSSSSSSLSTILSDIKITNDNVKLIQLKNIPNTATDNAKSVASEYLKMTTNEGSKKQQKQRSKQDWEDIESGSDQEPIIDGSKIVTTSTTISTTSLTTAVTTTTTVSGGSTTDMIARTVVVGEDGFKNPTTDLPVGYSPARLTEDGRSVCTVCSKTFQKEYHLLLHYNIHYIERKFRCEPCGVSFRTKGHLQKHERSVQHHNKVSMSTTYGVATTTNPRPFKCLDCKVAFRIHGHLAKHLRSKSHVMKLECIGKLPFGMYAEIERCSFSLTDIDTTDCDNSLASLLLLAQTIHEKDPTKFGNWTPDNVVIINNKILPSSDIRHINNVSGVVGGGNGESGDSDDSEQILDDTNPILNENSSNSINTVGGINSGGIVVVNSGVIGGVGSIGGGGGDSAFSSDSSTGSIKRKIDAITGSLDPSLPDDILIHEKRLKITTSSDT